MLSFVTARVGRWTAASALLASLALVMPCAARAADASASEGDPEIKAREAFVGGRYEEAIASFAKLYARTLNPTYLRNIARSYQKMREPQKAIDEFHDYLLKTKSGKYAISPEEREEIEGYVKEMQALRDEQTRAAAPVTPLVVPAAVSPVVAAPTMTLTAVAPPPQESPPIYHRWWFWTIVGVVAVGGAATAVALGSGTTRPRCISSGGCK